MQNIIITASAQDYLSNLLEKQNCEGIGIRMFVSDPGTPRAETCTAYSRPGEHNEDDDLANIPGNWRCITEKKASVAVQNSQTPGTHH